VLFLLCCFFCVVSFVSFVELNTKSSIITMVLFKVATSVLILLSATQAINNPLGISNCHYSQWFEKARKCDAVSSSGAVEIILAMGLAYKIASTAWIMDVWEPLDANFQKLNRYPTYPSAKELIDSNPDMIYATYSSAFEDPVDPSRVIGGDRLNYTEALGLKEPCNVMIPSNSYGSNKTYCRDEIHEKGIGTYLPPSYCEFAEHRFHKFDGIKCWFYDLLQGHKWCSNKRPHLRF